MALVKISELPAASTLTGAEEYPLNQSGNTRKGTGGSGGYSSTDAIIYVSKSPNASDTYDGLSPGRPKATLLAALTAMGTSRKGTILLTEGQFTVPGGIPNMGDYECCIKGIGDATEIVITSQTGAALDYTGMNPGFEVKRTILSDLQIRGDGTAGAAKKGVVLGGSGGLVMRNVTIRDTGGTPLELNATLLCDFYSVVLNSPVSADTNDIPWLKLYGAANGNRFYGLGLRSSITTSEGVTGAIVLAEDATYAPEKNEFHAPWVEYLHIPTNGCIFRLTGGLNTVINPEWFDCSKMAGATNTCYIKMVTAAVGELGGNIVTGHIPGTQGGSTIDFGVIVSSSGNHIDGVKGYNGSNVKLTAGVNRNFVSLGGSEVSATNAAFIDDSATNTNTLIDWIAQSMKIGDTTVSRSAAGTLRVANASTPTSGKIELGSAGAALYGNPSATFYMDGDGWICRDLSLNILSQINAFVSEGATSLFLRRKLGGVQSLQEISYGAADSGGAGYRLLRMPN